MKIHLRLVKNIFLSISSILILFFFVQNNVHAQSTVYTEDFNAFTTGSFVGDDADWYDDGNGPVIGAADGVDASKGLGAANNIFTWSTHTFNWNATDFESVSFQMDYKTDGSAHFDDDRIGWMINNPTTSSSNIMAVQLDPGGSGYNIEGYWDGVTADDKTPTIVSLTSLTADTWYRFWVKFTKLTSTSCSIDVSLTELDGSGNPTGTPVTGSIANTATLGDDEPNAKYFTSGLSPAFKNFTAAAAPADNAYYEIVTILPTPTISITGTPLTSFSSTPGNPSYEQNYTIEGSDLTDDITISAPTDFEVSTTSGSGFGSSVVLTESGGSVSSTLIYVRFNRATDGTSSGDITNSSPGVTAQNVAVSGTANYQASSVYTEDFNTFTTGTMVGDDADWFDGGGGPVIGAANGVAGTKGLANSGAIFTWIGNPFDWNAADFLSIKLKMDFQANGSGAFDDDRIGWMIYDNSTSSDFIFGIQLDNASGHSRIETYWDNTFGDNAGRVEMADLDGVTITADGWYRLITDITRLDATSARIDGELWSLDGSGNPVSMIASGSVSNTAAVGSGLTPNPGYFTGPIYPAYKNHSGTAGAADNTYFELVTIAPPPAISITGTPLTPFSSIPGNPSDEQNYSVEGSNLIDDISITAPTDFEVSTTSGSGFGSSVVLTQSGGSVSSTPIYVRFNRATEGTSGGDITNSSTGGNTQNVAVSGTATAPPPIMSITGTPLTAFSSTPGNPSDEQNYTVEGSNLTDDISITAPTDFEVSTTSGSGFGSSVVLTESGGSVSSTPIYVRFNRATEGTSSGDITNSSAGVATQNVAVNGTAAATDPKNIYVSTTGSNTDDGTSWGDAYLTINYAVTQASIDDTINVEAGVYNEDLLIDVTGLVLRPKTGDAVTIKGVTAMPVAGWPAAGPNIEILASGVNINGFTIESPAYVSGFYSSGIVIGGADVEIYNNAFKVWAGNDAGVGDEISQAIQTYYSGSMPGVDISGLSIHDNTFTNLNSGTVWGYEGIYINLDEGTGPIGINNNQFNGELVRAITVERSEADVSLNTIITDLPPLTTSGALEGISIRNLAFVTQNNITVSNNEVKGSDAGKGFLRGIRLGIGGQTLSGITAADNALSGNTTGVLVRSSANGVLLNNNQISGNTTGITNEDAANILNAENNWWGDASGPSGFGPGTGDAVSDYIDFDPWIGKAEIVAASGAVPLTISFPLAGVDMTFTTLPVGGGTVTVQRYSEAPAGYPDPPAGATYAGLLLDISSTMPNYSFNVDVTVDVTGLGFDATKSIMYFNSTTNSWVAVNNGTYAAGSPETYTFTTNHFTPFSFINTPGTAYNIYLASSPTATASNVIYPNDLWGATSYDPDDWNFTTTPIEFYIVPEVGTIFSASDIVIQWDNTLYSFAGVDETDGLFDGATFQFLYNQLGEVDQVTINCASSLTTNFTTVSGDYICKLQLNLLQPGFGPINFVSMDFRAYDGVGGQEGVYFVGNGAAVKSYLGDVAASGDASTGDGLVNFEDAALWAVSYWSGVPGFAGGMTNYKVKYDVGPTADNTVYTLPTEDGMIQFEDLVIFAISYGLSGDNIYPKTAPAPETPVELHLGEPMYLGNETLVPLTLKGTVVDVRALELTFGGSFGKLVSVEKGALLQNVEAPVVIMDRSTVNSANVDLAIFGADVEGLNAEGEILTLRFEGRADVQLSSANVRNSGNNSMKIEITNSNITAVPTSFALDQNYPNPFNPTTIISYQLPEQQYVNVVIFNMLGEEVSTLVNEVKEAGYHKVEWSGSNLTSGVYFYRIEAGDFVSVKKMMLMK